MEGSKMSFTLSAKQVEVLSAAAQHADRLLAIPPQFKGAVAQRLATKLISEGLAKEVKAQAGPTNWRRDAATGQAYALKLTAAGLKAVAVEATNQTEAVEAGETLAPTNARATRRMSRSHSDDVGRAESGGEKRGTNRDFTNTTEASLRAPRVGSKIDRVLGMLAADKGATLAELIGATGWLPHTTRAALTGLRKRGFDVLLSRGDGASVYRATAPTRGSAR
jgi:hypothetical protein